MQDDVVCYHEAGHAVMSVLLGRKVLFATVDTGEEGGGSHHGLTSNPHLKLRRIRGTKQQQKGPELLGLGGTKQGKGVKMTDVAREAKIALAGPVAESMHTGVPLELVYDERSNDYDKVYVLVAGYLHIQSAEPTDADIDNIIDAVHALAQVMEELLEEHWEKVTLVAEALSKKRHLTGPELRRLMKGLQP